MLVVSVVQKSREIGILRAMGISAEEVAYDDDYRFKPDPVICYDVPKDGEYVFAIYDSIYRGREDFVYRITVGEQPFVTSIFPLGARWPTSSPPRSWRPGPRPVLPAGRPV